MSRKCSTKYACDGGDCYHEIDPDAVPVVNRWRAICVKAEEQYQLGSFFHFCSLQCALPTLADYADRQIIIDPFLKGLL